VDLEETVVRRRRGAELEAALLDAAWQELRETGYAALTIDAVAQRAGTSRPVLYRRWATKTDLVRAAVEHALRREQRIAPDTGTLRGDLLALMHFANAGRVPAAAGLVYHLGSYFQETGTSPAALRLAVLGDRPSELDQILDRAIERGEIDAARLTPRRRTLAFDLFRHEALMTLAPVPDEVVHEIVDDIFMPLVAPRPS
jgi:AcrR family transcriptional regulator